LLPLLALGYPASKRRGSLGIGATLGLILPTLFANK
jgi:hypothetical protein